MIPDRRSPLAIYIVKLLSGRTTFTAQEAVSALNVSHGAFLDAAERLQRRKALLRPRQGFYIAVPPKYLKVGAPPPPNYIDALMKHENENYYVALLNAAEHYGAFHQAVNEFQVITSKRIPELKIGRSRIAFFYRKDLSGVAAGIERRCTEEGIMQMSSPALTTLDLLRYPQAVEGLDSIATMLRKLASQIDRKQLASLSNQIERPVVQRLGFLLDHLGFSAKASAMHKALFARPVINWVELDRNEVIDPDLPRKVIERNSRWRIIVRRYPNPDE